ncbi:hypothetical protein ACQKMD_17370 [Viridibacillus sp. NPDC096237]|uniref:hypothetical protein n=1 Tax=Viridibacillus sp. NPDC096237 TaxID=3390721 RepID=UPI003D005176
MKGFDLLLFLSFLLILLFVSLIVIFIRTKSKSIYANQRPVKIFIGVYVAILVVSPIIYFAISKNEVQMLTDAEREKLNDENKALHKALLKSKTEQYADQFLIDEWALLYKEKELYLKMENPNESISVSVVVQKSDSTKQQITGKLYRANFVKKNIDITNKLNVPTISWTDSKTMLIKKTVITKLTYATMSDNTLFNNNEDSIWDSSSLEWGGDGYSGSPYYLLLSVPKDVKVWSDEELRIDK